MIAWIAAGICLVFRKASYPQRLLVKSIGTRLKQFEAILREEKETLNFVRN